MDDQTLAEECPTMKDVFERARSDDLSLYLRQARTGQAGFKSLIPQDDYALVEILPEHFDESVCAGTLLLPYGGSVGYSLEHID